MGDRYRYGRPRSPVMYNPARASLPINVYATPAHEQEYEHHIHVVPTSRREIANPRSSVSSVATAGPVTKTTYKVTADPLARSSRGTSRTRSSTLDTVVRPIVVPSPPRAHRPVVHSAGGRPASPPLLKNPYRSSEEEYYAIPATSKHGHHHHRKRHSATTDTADMLKLAKERESGRLRIGVAREERGYTGVTRARPMYTNSAVRHPDTVSADYGDNGYGYTNPRDLVQYDLNNSPALRVHTRNDSYEGGRMSRPSSISSYQDLASPRVTYDTRERGPPPSTRGFDKIQPRGGTWEQPSSARMPAVPPPPPMEPIQRPGRVEPPFIGEPPRRRESLTRRNDRPASLYHIEPRREPQRDEYYETRDDSRRDRPRRHERFDDSAEQGGFGLRPERSDRGDRNDAAERLERSPDDRDSKDHKEHKGAKEAVAAGLSIAGAALGANALKKVRSHDDRDDRDEREERRRRMQDDEYDEEPRRRRETRDEREPVDLSNRDPRERKHRDIDLAPPPPPAYGREINPDAPIVDLSGRDPKERHNSREDRPRDDRKRDERSRQFREVRDRSDSESRERDRTRRHRSEASIAAAATAVTAAAAAGSAIDSREGSSASEDAPPKSRREPSSRHGSNAGPAPFNPKDTTDLKALKEELNKSEASPPKDLGLPKRSPRESVSNDARDLAKLRTDLNSSEYRGRDASVAVAPSKENRQIRVVSPPREKSAEKAVKGILRPPREKFPEDPSPVREGVAPLKDAKKDGVPPDARWTKISRKLVNPAALEAGKERFEEREDFVIVLRVLSRDEVQGYAEVTQRIRAMREEQDRQERRRARRERHERHKRERSEREDPELGRGERAERRRRRTKDRGSASESDTTDESSYEGERERERPKMIESANPVMSGGLGDVPGVGNNLREDPDAPGQYTGYTRNPPPPTSIANNAGVGRNDKT